MIRLIQLITMTMAVKRNLLDSLLLLVAVFSASVLAQTDPKTQLTVSPEGTVQPGTKITLTCEFNLAEQDLHWLRFYKNNSVFPMLEYTKDSEVWDPKIPLVSLEHDKDFTTDRAKMWMSFSPSFCDEATRVISYKCSFRDSQRFQWEAWKRLTFAGPSLEVTMDEQKINDPLTLEHDVIGSEKVFKLAAANYPEKILVLQLQINGAQLEGSFVPKNKEDICVYGGERSGSYTFPKPGVYQLEYTLETTGDPIIKTIAVTVKEKPSTTSTTTTTTTTVRTEKPIPSPKYLLKDTSTMKPEDHTAQTNVIGIGSGPSSVAPGITWQSFENGALPRYSSAVKVNDDEFDTYYVGRISGLGGIFPSKIHTTWGAAYFGLDGLEITSKNYDALVVTDSSVTLTWTPASGGAIPAGAIAGGHAPNDASHLYYVASAQTSAGQTIGYLDPAQGCATVSQGWGSQCYSDYKVLVAKY